MDVFALLFIASFIALVITLVVMHIIKMFKNSKPYTPYSEYYAPSVLFVDGKNTNIKVHNSLQERADKYLETVPSHKTRVTLRKKRQRRK